MAIIEGNKNKSKKVAIIKNGVVVREFNTDNLIKDESPEIIKNLHILCDNQKARIAALEAENNVLNNTVKSLQNEINKKTTQKNELKHIEIISVDKIDITGKKIQLYCCCSIKGSIQDVVVEISKKDFTLVVKDIKNIKKTKRDKNV